LTFLVPLNSFYDSSQKKNWLHEFEFVIKNLYAYVKGLLVAVTYYLNMPDSYRVPVPIGFISTDVQVIHSVTQSLNGYLTEFHDENQRKDLGILDR
jgi:hypothetical protein